MKQSRLFGRTTKTLPKDEVSQNAQLLIRAGYVDKLTAGVFTYLPLGLRVLQKVQNIIREEINAVDGQEILMPALTPKDLWLKTGRWEGLDVLFKLEGAGEKEYALGATHEEVVTPLAKNFVRSYKDLPFAVYQIQDKFRNEARAKSGILRGREFNMKDLYSFHAEEADLDAYYEKVKQAYLKIYERCGLSVKVVEASGGTFSKLSHEFQLFTEAGEDTIYYCDACDFAQNQEIATVKEGEPCPRCGLPVKVAKAIEVGNIFKLYAKYSQPFDLTFMDEKGEVRDVLMGCYGIGPSRTVGAIVEVHHDEKGIVWPESVAPFAVHLLNLNKDDAAVADDLYQKLSQAGVEVLYDDRDESAGTKFNDADLLGLPHRLVVSAKTIAVNKIEYKKRDENTSRLLDEQEVLHLFPKK